VIKAVLAVSLLLAAAEEGTAPQPTAQDGEPQTTAESSLEERVRQLEEELARLREEQEAAKEDEEFVEERVDRALRLSGRLSGYIDVGLFDVGGDGSGLRNDLEHRYFPEYDQVPDAWVFMGDPLASPINSRGDPASTAESRAITFDPIRSGGAPGFIVNNVHLALLAGIGERAKVGFAVDALPRTRLMSDVRGLLLGDFLDVKLAWAEYRLPLSSVALTFSAGKFDPVLGVEYRTQEAPLRLTVTPSLLCRYTCGRPLGVKVRSELLQGALTFNVALTNGSSLLETFAFHTETDTNLMKTLSARAAWHLPVGAGLEVGASGSAGAQDAQPANGVLQWHYGLDVHGDWNDVVFAAEFVRGRAEGQTEPDMPACNLAPCIDYRGAYGQVGYRWTNWLEPYVRVDWRRALHRSGASFVYISNLARASLGARLELDPAVVLKAEYVWNQELGRIPSFPNDVIVSSLVVRY
jgi:outer membrane murein-binding lipoprotein Lpp